MANAPDPWFVTERSESLARLLLTTRNDVHVQSERKLDDRLILHVEIATGDPLSSQLFVVQVKGTTSSDPTEWMQNVKQLFRGSGAVIYLPVCVFVVNVRENTAFYAWMAEPLVEDNGTTLRFYETGAFHPLDAAAVSEIVERVKGWYAARAAHLQPV